MWISVKDQLPEYSVRVLVYFSDNADAESNVRGNVFIGCRDSTDVDGEQWEIETRDCSGIEPFQRDASHWQALTTPEQKTRRKR